MMHNEITLQDIITVVKHYQLDEMLMRSSNFLVAYYKPLGLRWYMGAWYVDDEEKFRTALVMVRLLR